MKRLNPLYVILLFLTIAFLSFYMLNIEKDNYELKVKELEQLKVKSSDFKQLKSSWSNKEFVNKTLDQILRNKTFSNQKVLRVQTTNAIKLKMESFDPKVLDMFLNKILNKQLIIKKLELDKTYINLEIGVK